MDELSQRLLEVEHRVANLEALTSGNVLEAVNFRRLGTNGGTSKPVELPKGGDAATGVESQDGQGGHDRWMSGIVANFNVAARDLDLLQDEVREMKRTVSALQGSTSVVKFKLASAVTNEVNARASPCQSSIFSRQCRIEAALATEFPALRADISDIADSVMAIKARQESWERNSTSKLRDLQVADCTLLEDVRHMQKKFDRIPELEAKFEAKLDFKLDAATWQEKHINTEAHLITLREMLTSMGDSFSQWHQEANETFESHHKDIRTLLVRAQF
mmetsp:Transcript_37108/g.69133  ORF Transcript_37108/g.69133 Transcript_37108/m.69133 type:complete len:275 (+) Transcript_37108:71-895(+)